MIPRFDPDDFDPPLLLGLRSTVDLDRPSDEPAAPMPEAIHEGDRLLPLDRPVDRATESDSATRGVESPDMEPVVFVPQGYEPNYAYPLLVWLTPPGRPTEEYAEVMRGVSDRNYLGVAVPVDEAEMLCAEGVVHTPECPAEKALDDESPRAREVVAEVADRVRAAVDQVRQSWSVHTGRVFIAGYEAAGTLAVLVQLQQPNWFAGVAAVSPSLPGVTRSLARLRDLSGKRVFLGLGRTEPVDRANSVRALAQLLNAARMRVCERRYARPSTRSKRLLRDLDSWIMYEIYHPAMS